MHWYLLVYIFTFSNTVRHLLASYMPEIVIAGHRETLAPIQAALPLGLKVITRQVVREWRFCGMSHVWWRVVTVVVVRRAAGFVR